jgi:hypothetical protein
MTEHDPLLEELLARLRASYGARVLVLQKGDGRLCLQFGSGDDAVIDLRIEDPLRPSFAVSYPALTVKRNGRRHVRRVHVSGVLVAGIEWIAKKLVRDGVVRPEFD